MLCDTEFRAALPGQDVTHQDKAGWKEKAMQFMRKSYPKTDLPDAGFGKRAPKVERIATYRHLLAKDSQLQQFVPGGLRYFQTQSTDHALVRFAQAC